MIESLAAWAVSAWGKRVLRALGIAILVGGFAAYFYSRGKSNGHLEGVAQGTQDVRKIAEADHGQQQAKIDALEVKNQGLTDSIARSDAALVQSARILTEIQQQRKQDRSAVSQLPDAQVFSDVVHKLNVRDASDTSQTFTAPELRKIDEIVTDYPHVVEALNQTNSKVDELAGKIDALSAKVDLVTQQRNASVDYGNRVYGYYVSAYNAAQTKPGFWKKVFTLGIAKGKHANLPDPISVKL